jgi:hypothetical protein
VQHGIVISIAAGIIEDSLETLGCMTLSLDALESSALAASKHGAREPVASGDT